MPRYSLVFCGFRRGKVVTVCSRTPDLIIDPYVEKSGRLIVCSILSGILNIFVWGSQFLTPLVSQAGLPQCHISWTCLCLAYQQSNHIQNCWLTANFHPRKSLELKCSFEIQYIPQRLHLVWVAFPEVVYFGPERPHLFQYRSHHLCEYSRGQAQAEASLVNIHVSPSNGRQDLADVIISPSEIMHNKK